MLSKAAKKRRNEARRAFRHDAVKAPEEKRPRVKPEPIGFLKDEIVLDDEHPVNGGFVYIVDGVIRRSDWMELTVRQWRNRLKVELGVDVKEVRRCSMYAPERADFAIGDRA
jgi:hypothetical protein